MKTIFFESIDNTQNYALENYVSEPLLVVSYSQDSGRGRENKEWKNADQSLATSLVFENNNEKLNNTERGYARAFFKGHNSKLNTPRLFRGFF